MLHTQEHADLVAQFERDCGIKGPIATKEHKKFWPQGNIYCHGETNVKFLAYRQGYAYGKARFQSEGAA